MKDPQNKASEESTAVIIMLFLVGYPYFSVSVFR